MTTRFENDPDITRNLSEGMIELCRRPHCLVTSNVESNTHAFGGEMYGYIYATLQTTSSSGWRDRTELRRRRPNLVVLRHRA